MNEVSTAVATLFGLLLRQFFGQTAELEVRSIAQFLVTLACLASRLLLSFSRAS